MNGADAIVQRSAAAGIEICFANPGTTEMALVDALRRSTEVRSVLALFEGVASGAADGWARIRGAPAAVLLHLGPGLANATANLHNARRAQSPVVCWVGDHTTWLLQHDPPLASDIESIAQGASKWIRTARDSKEIGRLAVDAVVEARREVPGVATLVLPADLQEAPVEPGDESPTAEPVALDAAAIEEAVRALREAKRPLILLGGHALSATALADADRIAQSCGGDVALEQFPRCLARGPGVIAPPKLPYLPFMARSQLADRDVVVVVGADRPTCFFGYDGEAPQLTDASATVIEPAAGGRDVARTLAAIADGLGASELSSGAPRRERADVGGALTPDTVCAVLANQLPENAIVVDEGITSSLALYPALTGAAPHDYLACKGGSIGYGTPVATGAALAAPGRRVVTYVGDGSAAYTIQSLWTQARESLDVTTIILANQSYAVLQMELMRTGSPIEGAARSMTEIGEPSLDFESIARGFGVPATTARDVEAFAAAVERSFATAGPSVVVAAFR